MTDQSIALERFTQAHIPLLATLDRMGYDSETSYYGLIPTDVRQSLDIQARTNSQYPEDPHDRDFKLKRNFERKLVDANKQRLVIVLAGEYHQPSMLNVLKYKGYIPRIISATKILNNSSETHLPTLETNYLRHQTNLERQKNTPLNSTLFGDIQLNSQAFIVNSRQTIKLPAVAIFIGDQHGVEYTFELPTSEDLIRSGINAVLFYGEHGDHQHFHTIDSLTTAEIGDNPWSGYQQIGKSLGDYNNAGLNIDIVGFEVEPQQ